MVEDTIAELQTLLAEEREAILRLDGAAVFDMAQRKRALVTRLRDERGPLSPQAATSFRALLPALRHNGILLAHGRDVLRDAITAARAERRTAAACVLPTAAPRRCLSVRG